MRLFEHLGTTVWMALVTSLMANLIFAVAAVAARRAQRRFTDWRRRVAARDRAPVCTRPRRSDPVRHVPLTLDQEADLIKRGLPELLVRSGGLDYASLTSGSMADRIRNGYA